MKKFFGALAVGAIVFGAVLASASLLPVDQTGYIQAGGDENLTCQVDPVTIGYGTMVNSDGKFAINSVVIGNVAGSCVGGLVNAVMITGHPTGSGATIAKFIGGTPLVSPTTTITIPDVEAVPVTVVDEIQLVFKGPGSPT